MPEKVYSLKTPIAEIDDLSGLQKKALRAYEFLGELDLPMSQLKRIRGIADRSARAIRELVAEAKFADAEARMAEAEKMEAQVPVRLDEELEVRMDANLDELGDALDGSEPTEEDPEADAMVEEEAAVAEDERLSRLADELGEMGYKPVGPTPDGLGYGVEMPFHNLPPAPLSDDDPAVIAAVDRLASLPPAPHQHRHEIPWDNETIRKILTLDRRWPAPGLDSKARMVLVFLQQDEDLEVAAEKAGYEPSEDVVGMVVETVQKFFERVALMTINKLPRR